jgi:hypothetical protein
VIETPQGDLVAGMKRLLVMYTGWFNRRHRFRDYSVNRYREYLKAPQRRRPWLRVVRLLGELHLPSNSVAEHRQL